MPSKIFKRTSRISIPPIPYVAAIMNFWPVRFIASKFKTDNYDLPLHKDEDTRFLILLVFLMSFLAILALSGALALSSMTSRWSSGLENKVTIEVPVETADGHLLSHDTVRKETQKVQDGLQDSPLVRSSKVLSELEIQDLISPWIGTDLTLDEIPLPGLIAVELNISTPESLENLRQEIKGYSRHAILEDHHEWLKDLTHFARNLQILALLVAILIGSATIMAIAGGIRTRMTIHKDEVELLHLMGATDQFIAGQFQHHALLITLKGTLMGTGAGLLVTLIIVMASYHSQSSLIPAINISMGGFSLLLCVPVLTLLISAVSARFTVLRTLGNMP